MNIHQTYQSGIYTLHSEQYLTCTLEEAWLFFSDPRNLDKITPKDMGFRITNKPAITTYEGQIITYKIGIFPLIDTNWVTEITHLRDRQFFVDEQRFGPYAMWHHEHHFEELPDGRVLMTDIVNYKVPLGWLGRVIAGGMVSKKVYEIFRNRYVLLENYFNTPSIR